MVDLKQEFLNITKRIFFSEPLKRHTSFRIGGEADFFVEVFNYNELIAILKLVKKHNLPFYIIGAGTNLLISDEGFRGAVIRLRNEFENVAFNNETIKTGAGTSLFYLIKRACDNDLSGMESLIGIPGTVGGALVMNAGVPDCEIGDFLQKVSILDSNCNKKILTKNDVSFFYRDSSLKDCIILDAEFKLFKGEREKSYRIMNDYLLRRLQTQPMDYFNVGSIFKNPTGDYAGRLIELAGLKGLTYGGAKVSEKHSNFIINFNNAKFFDVLYLINEIKKRVKEKFSVELELEIKVIP